MLDIQVVRLAADASSEEEDPVTYSRERRDQLQLLSDRERLAKQKEYDDRAAERRAQRQENRLQVAMQRDREEDVRKMLQLTSHDQRRAIAQVEGGGGRCKSR